MDCLTYLLMWSLDVYVHTSKYVPVTESGNVGHLRVGHGEQLVPVIILHLHDVEHALHILLQTTVNALYYHCHLLKFRGSY